MRDLHTGEIALAAEGEAPLVVSSGRAPSQQAFLASMGQAIADAARLDGRILVFRARACPIRLHRWSEPAAPPLHELDAAIEDQLLRADPSLVILRLGADVIGFASEPGTHEQAEALGGVLAAALALVIGDSWPRVGLAPRLGVAIVDGVAAPSAELAAAVADAVQAVDRTIAQTTVEAPYLVHNDYIRTRSLRQGDIASALEVAMAERQITLEFQPRATATGLVHVGLEVFPRWHSADLGPIPTVEFLRVAEANGLLGHLGRQVRADAIAMARRWAADGTLGDRRLWFDLAPIEMLDRPFVDEVAALIDQHDDIRVGFEISDGPLLEEAVFAPVFEALEELGVDLALDNVRPSTLSFGRMQKLPLAHVNLDRELARTVLDDTGQQDLVRAICGFANDRGMAVTACQVESADELALLADLGVDLVQGFAVSEPLAEADLWPQLDRAVSTPVMAG